MTTNKNRINAYVDDRAFKAFESFCQHWQVSYSRGVEILLHKYLIGDFELKETVTSNVELTPSQIDEITAKVESNLESVTSNLELTPSQIDEITAKVESNLDGVIGNLLANKLPDREKLEKAITLVDEQEEILGKVEALARHNKEMEAELREAREKIEQIELQSQQEEVGIYPEDAIKLLETEAETEKPKEEIPDKVRSLSIGTELTGKELAFLMGVNATYPSKYKSGKVQPPSWFWDNFEATGEGNKSRWLKK